MKTVLRLAILFAAFIHFASVQVYAAALMKDNAQATHEITESKQIDVYYDAQTNPADFYMRDDNGRQFVSSEGIDGSLYYQYGGVSVLSLAQLSSYLQSTFYNVEESNSITTISGRTKGEGLPKIEFVHGGMVISLFDGTTNVGASSFAYSNLYSWEDETGFTSWEYRFRGSDLLNAIDNAYATSPLEFFGMCLNPVGTDSEGMREMYTQFLDAVSNADTAALVAGLDSIGMDLNSFNAVVDAVNDALNSPYGIPFILAGLNPVGFDAILESAFVFDFGTDTYLDSLKIQYEGPTYFNNVTLNYNAYDTSTATPEPASMLIFGVGLAIGALPLIRQRKRMVKGN
ncbi:MAG: hypothetical protein LBU65_00655 [Planctomycetaceae bacterium]|jgi:hypothetical protein|nr:hypothetical protein [Planctomycetaceae bacterium]